MTRLALRTAALAGFLSVVAGCSEQTVEVELRSLQSSGDVSYVCRTPEGVGVPENECSPGSLFSGQRDLFALVTQTSTGEVAVINVPWDVDDHASDEGVVDVDPSAPGYGFLRIGARPGDIVSTPGGQATFVAVSEPGRPGIFALPTPCVGPPRAGESARDLTTWPACSLPAAPGGLAIAFDPAGGRCGTDEASPPVEGRECGVDLATEGGPSGRRKLVVSLPDRGSLAVIDAQELLDREQGKFEPCVIESELPLAVDLPAAPLDPELPPDLVGCAPAPSPLPAGGPVASARPTQIAAADGRLYVADESAPVVHVVDVGAACTPREMPPLLPSSYWAPQRSVTVSRLAVSPLTPKGRRFVYAIDELDWPVSSLMAFDVSPGSTRRTPILRPGSTLMPQEPPDRITFGAAVRDIGFVLRDRPEFGEDGAVPLGETCEPDPARSDAPGARYRPNVQRSTGARPLKLRGVFGMAMLTTGDVAVVDVEDFDAPCRRPRRLNPAPEEDFSGCAADPPLASGEYALDDVATVTDEVSCRAVEPHTRRAERLALTRSDVGSQAPSLRSLPTLGVPRAAQTLDLQQRPKLLAVEDLARVFVGITEYSSEPVGRGPELRTDPRVAEEYSLGLPYNQPRAYPAADELQLEFEGAVSEIYQSGFFRRGADGQLGLSDPAALFCNAGVQDPELATELGRERFGLRAEAERESGDPRPSVEQFAMAHSDHIVITADFPDEEDAYWPGSVPLDPANPELGALECTRAVCEQEFGELPEPLEISELDVARQLSIEDAEQQRLRLEVRYYRERVRDLEALDCERQSDPSACAAARDAARAALESERSRRLGLVECCFPAAASYQVRASGHWTLLSSAFGFRHDVIPVAEVETDGRAVVECRRDCDPRKRGMQSRVFEIGRDGCTPREGLPCQVNACITQPREVTDANGVRQVEPAHRAVHADDAAWACVHGTSTARFALYQGLAPSQRGMAFGWQVIGGFSPMTFELSVVSPFVAPQAVAPLPGLDRISVVDAASLGLVLIGLDDLRVLLPTLN